MNGCTTGPLSAFPHTYCGISVSPQASTCGLSDYAPACVTSTTDNHVDFSSSFKAQLRSAPAPSGRLPHRRIGRLPVLGSGPGFHSSIFRYIRNFTPPHTHFLASSSRLGASRGSGYRCGEHTQKKFGKRLSCVLSVCHLLSAL